MTGNSGSVLKGIGEISKYVNRSEVTVLRWVRELGFPARKDAEGVWVAKKKLVDEWRRDMTSLGMVSKKKPEEEKKKVQQAPRERRW